LLHALRFLPFGGDIRGVRFESAIDDFLASTFHVSRIDLLMNPNKLEVEVKELLLNKNIKEPIDHVFRNMSDDFSKKARLQFKRSLHFIIPNLKDKPLMGKVAPEADDAIFEDMRSSMLTSMQKRLVSDNAQLLAMMDHETLTKVLQRPYHIIFEEMDHHIPLTCSRLHIKYTSNLFAVMPKVVSDDTHIFRLRYEHWWSTLCADV
jgi:hypothetical protein